MTQLFSTGPADDARPQDIDLYAALLSFTRDRLVRVTEMIAAPPRNRVDIESCALQVRIALEQVVLSTLIANRPAAAMVVAAFAKKKAADVHGLIKRINPRYWPIPFDPEPAKLDGWERWDVQRMVEPREPYLHEDEWGGAYGYCSSVLHATNPYQYLRKDAKTRDERHSEHIVRLWEYSSKIWRLLKFHQVYLSETNHSLVCELPLDLRIKPTVAVHTKVAKGVPML